MLLLTGCAVQKTVTITTRPPDAVVKVNGAERGRGNVIEKFVFQNPGDVFYVTASRKGYQDRTVTVTRESVQDTLPIELKPHVRRINVVTSPPGVPAIISVDGKPLTAEPASAVSADVEFTVDAQDNWIAHVISAERKGFVKAEATVNWQDNQSIYTLKLDAMRKDLRITTNPPGATVEIDGVAVGTSPISEKGTPFDYDIGTNNWIDKTIKISKAGYDPIERKIGWDNGQSDYTIDLIPKQKTVNIKSDPPGATITVEGATVKPSADGVTAELIYTPVNDKGDLRTYKVKATKKTADAEWYPAEMTVAWDNGKPDYVIKLREVLSQPTPGTVIRMIRDKNEWKPVAEQIKTISMKFVTEPEGAQAQPIVKLEKGQTIGSISVSPDGQYLVYSVVGGDADEPTSQIFRIRADGSGSSTQLSDGRSLELTPSYTAAGDRIVFSSNRATQKLVIWSLPADGMGGVQRLTQGQESSDLWPTVDAEAKPRLFYQTHVDRQPEPRLYKVDIGANIPTDLTQQGGMMPRVSPKNDSVLYVYPNQKSGKREIYRVSDKGGLTEALVSDGSDNTDPAWNSSGSKFAFASDRAKDSEDKRANFDIFVQDSAGSGAPVQITHNGSVDDMPVFDPSGDAIFFRSNRGGVWGIWKISVK